MKKVLCTTSSFGSSSSKVLQQLKDAEYEPVVNPFGRKLTEAELVALIEEHDPVGLLAGTEPITRKCMEAAGGRLEVISRVGVGWDNVDHDAARDLGIPVLRTVGVLDQCVAELALGFMLSALRNIAHQDREMRNGVWKKRMGGMLSGKTVGIIGFGAIGQQLGRLLCVCGAKVMYFDTYAIEVDWAEAAGLDQVLEKAHIISLHVSCADQLLGAKELESTRPGVVLVNTARGGLIDEEALHRLLKAGHIGYACLDVFEKEPYDGPLLELDNVICSPHVGSYALEARIQMEEMAVDNFLEALSQGDTE